MSDDTGKRILTHIAKIAEFGHRWMASEGEKRTRNYIAEVLESVDLSVTRQPFDYKAYTDYRASFSVAGHSVLCEPLAYASATREPIEAPVLYVGQARPEDFKCLSDAGQDISQSIVLSDNLRSFAAYPEAEAAGARAFVLATMLPGQTIRCGSVRFDRTPGRIPAISISGDDSRALIEAIKATPPIYGRLHLECDLRNANGENIIGRTRQNQVNGRRIILSAHFDSFWNGIHAMDNLAGVATLIELARRLPSEIDSNLEFVFFGGEELGSWGAAGYVQQPDFDPESIRALINLDAFGSETSELEVGVTADLMDICRRTTTALNIVPDCWNCPPRTASDQKEFIPFGVPSVWIANNGADKHYHTPLDRVENIDPHKLQQVFLLARQLAQVLAKNTVNQP